MKAMILAAGLGTRLRPLTNDRPKALVEVGGRTMLDITLSRLRAFGIRDVIINVHYFADMIVEYLKKNDNFDMHIEISREDVLLDTGGGLKKAADFFLKDQRDRETPFVLHNVDVISTIDLSRMAEFHRENQALASLAVQDRETSRYLLFDERHHLCGRRTGRDQEDELVGSSKTSRGVSFFRHPHYFSAPLRTDAGEWHLLHRYCLSAVGRPRRKNPGVPGGRLLLA